MDNFNLKKFLTENKLTHTSHLREGFHSPADPNTVAYNKVKSEWDAGNISNRRYTNMKWMDLPDEAQKELYNKYKDDYYEDTMDVDTSGETYDYEMNEVVVATEMTTQETSGHAERFAKYMSDKEGKTFTVTAGSVDGPSFDLDLDGEKYEGGSFLISQAGEIINMALPENPVYGNISMLEGKKEYYKNAEADDAEHIKALDKDMKDDKKSSKMKESQLRSKIKEMVLAEMNLNISDETPESEEDFLAEIENMLNEASEFDINKPARIAEFLKALDLLLYDEYHAELFDSKEVKQAYDLLVKSVKKLGNLNEADEEATNELLYNPNQTHGEYEVGDVVEYNGKDHEVTRVETDRIYVRPVEPSSILGKKDSFWVKIDDLNEAKDKDEDTEEATDDITVDDTETIDTTTTTKVDPDVKEVQDALTQAQAAAQKLGDPKLTDQIGNTITFFTRAHIVEKGAVAENLNEAEGKLVDEETGEEVTLPYKTLDFRGNPMTVISFRAPHKSSSSGRITTKEGREYFPSVAGLKIIDHSFSEDLNESMFPMLKRILKSSDLNEDLNMSNTPEIENIISLLQGVDGETMEYILRQVGIEDQMKKQLSGETDDDEDEYNDMYHPKGFDI